MGEAFDGTYPADAGAVKLRLGEDYRGLRLPSFIGNTDGVFPVDRSTAKIIVASDTGRLEILPFVLLDHKGRPYSDDYVFLNPLERIDCLNEAASEVRRSTKGALRAIKRLVLDAAKAPMLRDFFRLGEKPNTYLLSETLVQRLREAGSTNLYLTEAPLHP
ncbi:MAG: hypothetical protein U5L05_14530 [Rubrivivax sp.]|nr:hypothetical protein [Rubrivivax sp.]